MMFNLKNVGKINNANISIKPLTIFIGQNDAGKTYAASSFWAIAHYVKTELKLTRTLENKIHRDVSAAIKKATEKINHEVVFDEDFIEKTYASIKKSIFSDSSKILKDTFNFDGFEKSRLSIENEHKSSIKIIFNITPELSKSESESSYRVIVELNDHLKFRLPPLRKSVIEKGFIEPLIHKAIRNYIIGSTYYGDLWEKINSLVYIPAARTGIMLALNYFIDSDSSKILENENENENENGRGRSGNLTAPLNAFAKKIQSAMLFGGSRSSPSKRLIEDLLGGRLDTTDNSACFYHPEGMENPIPLASSSSMVTELSPLSILDSSLHDSFVIFEEPEAHLHLAAQREIARAIVRLINNGCYLLITTHSDTFLQQINNLILLETHPQKASLLEELSLTNEDTTSSENVSAYDFRCDKEGTNVENLEFGKYGFVAESLNEVLISLSDETFKIIEESNVENFVHE